jgi:hypothetical protein
MEYLWGGGEQRKGARTVASKVSLDDPIIVTVIHSPGVEGSLSNLPALIRPQEQQS